MEMEMQTQEELDDYSFDKADLLSQNFLKQYDDPKVWQNKNVLATLSGVITKPD